MTSLGTVSKEQLLQSYQRIRAKYNQQRTRHAELARSCHQLEADCRQAQVGGWTGAGVGGRLERLEGRSWV